MDPDIRRIRRVRRIRFGDEQDVPEPQQEPAALASPIRDGDRRDVDGGISSAAGLAQATGGGAEASSSIFASWSGFAASSASAASSSFMAFASSASAPAAFAPAASSSAPFYLPSAVGK